jgi:hypothetical protein
MFVFVQSTGVVLLEDVIELRACIQSIQQRVAECMVIAGGC